MTILNAANSSGVTTANVSLQCVWGVPLRSRDAGVYMGVGENVGIASAVLHGEQISSMNSV